MAIVTCSLCGCCDVLPPLHSFFLSFPNWSAKESFLPPPPSSLQQSPRCSSFVIVVFVGFCVVARRGRSGRMSLLVPLSASLFLFLLSFLFSVSLFVSYLVLFDSVHARVRSVDSCELKGAFGFVCGIYLPCMTISSGSCEWG